MLVEHLSYAQQKNARIGHFSFLFGGLKAIMRSLNKIVTAKKYHDKGLMQNKSQPINAERIYTKEPNYIAPDGSQLRLGPAHFDLCTATFPARSISQAIKHKTVTEDWFYRDGPEEIYIWLSDHNRNAVYKIKANTHWKLPPGMSFQIFNHSDEPASFLIITRPSWPGSSESISVAGPLIPSIVAGDVTDNDLQPEDKVWPEHLKTAEDYVTELIPNHKNAVHIGWDLEPGLMLSPSLTDSERDALFSEMW